MTLFKEAPETNLLQEKAAVGKFQGDLACLFGIADGSGADADIPLRSRSILQYQAFRQIQFQGLVTLDFQHIACFVHKAQPDFGERGFQADFGKEGTDVADVQFAHFHVHVEEVSKVLHLVFGEGRAAEQAFHVADLHFAAGGTDIQFAGSECRPRR